jgi:hypothetical protein
MRTALRALFLIILIVAVGPRTSAQASPRLQTFFEQNIGHTPDQIADIGNGIPVVKIADHVFTNASPYISSITKTRPFTMMIRAVMIGIREGRRDASPNGIKPSI